MTICTLPVLVVGAGPSGLVAALTLLQNNIPVRIIEKERHYRQGQRGAGIHPRTFEAFHFLDAPEIHDLAKPLPPVQEHKRGSLEPTKIFSISPYTEPTPAIPYYNPKLLGQANLEAALRSHLAGYGCTVELGTRLASFTQDDTCVRVKLFKHHAEDGFEEEEEEDTEVAYLIGADGAKGVTRKLLGLSFLGSTRDDVRMVLGDVRLEVKGLDRDHWHFFGQMTENMISLRPTDELGNGGHQIIISSRTSDVTRLIHDEKSFVMCIKDFIGLGDAVDVKELLWLSEFRPNIRMVNKFGEGRVFVAGDAAHVHSPTGGQGLNSGVQDAFHIAWKLALVYKGLCPPSLLDTYTTERIPVIAEMLDLTTAMLGLMVDAPDAPKDITAEKVDDATGKPEKPRQAVKPSLERAMERGKKLYMLGVNYRTSPIVIDEFNPSPQMGVNNAYGIVEEGVLHAGDRAPDAPGLVPIIASGLASVPDASRLSPLSLIGDGPRSSRLFDIFAPTYHTVLIFVPSLSAPEVQRVLAVLRRLDGDIAKLLVVLPSGGHSKPPVEDGTTVEQSATGELRTDDERQLAFEGGVLLDRDGHAYDAYIVERGSAKVVVVRPDGVVGAIVRGAEGLGRYLDGIFGAVGTNGA